MKIPKILKPCAKCPYKMGLIKFVTSPCPACKENNYQNYYDLIAIFNHPLNPMSKLLK